jgi:putative membrane protein
MKKTTIASLVCALAMVAAPTAAFASASPHRASAPKISAIDVSWVQAGIQDNMAVVAAADLAEQRTQNVFALRVAHVMLSRHSRLLADTVALAKHLGISIPTSPSAAQQAQLTALQALTGKAFASTFAADLVSGRQEFIALTQQEIATGVNGAVRASAHFFLPIEQYRLGQAQFAVNAMAAH